MQTTPKLKLVSVTLEESDFHYTVSFEAEGLPHKSSVQVSVSVSFYLYRRRKHHPTIGAIEKDALPEAKDLLRSLAQEEN